MIFHDRLTFDDHINALCSRSAYEYIFSEFKLRLAKALVIPQFLFGNFLFEWLILRVYAKLRLLSIIMYGLFMTWGVAITSPTITGVSSAIVFRNTMNSGRV
jgi:hypothetical protein